MRTYTTATSSRRYFDHGVVATDLTFRSEGNATLATTKTKTTVTTTTAAALFDNTLSTMATTDRVANELKGFEDTELGFEGFGFGQDNRNFDLSFSEAIEEVVASTPGVHSVQEKNGDSDNDNDCVHSGDDGKPFDTGSSNIDSSHSATITNSINSVTSSSLTPKTPNTSKTPDFGTTVDTTQMKDSLDASSKASLSTPSSSSSSSKAPARSSQSLKKRLSVASRLGIFGRRKSSHA